MTDIAEDLRIQRDGRTWLLEPRDFPSHDERLLLDHVRYDIETACGLLRAVQFNGRLEGRDFPERTIRRFRGDALIEALLLHVRAVDEFFHKDQIVGIPRRWRGPYLPRISHEDVMAVDFVRDPQAWLDTRPPRDPRLKAAKFRIDKTVVHLNRKRVIPGQIDDHVAGQKEQAWGADELVRCLVPSVEAFLSQLRAELWPGFGERVRYAIEHLEPTPEDLIEMEEEVAAQNRALLDPDR